MRSLLEQIGQTGDLEFQCYLELTLTNTKMNAVTSPESDKIRRTVMSLHQAPFAKHLPLSQK